MRPIPRSASRGPAALAIAAVTLLVFLAVGGFAAAGDASAPPIREFGLPAPHAGDQANFSLGRATLGADGELRPDGSVRPLFGFARLQRQFVRDGEGRPHFTDVLATVRPVDVPSPSGTRTLWVRHTTYTTLADQRLIAFGDQGAYGQSWDATTPLLPAPLVTNWRGGYGIETVHHFPNASATPNRSYCAVSNHLQGIRLAVDRPVALFHPCYWLQLWTGGGVEQTAFSLVDAAEEGGRTVAVFAGAQNGFPVYVWFASDVPYTLQVFFDEGWGGGQLLRLTAFERGDTPLVAAAAPPAGAPHAEWTGRQATLLDESGVGLPFSLTSAWDQARSDPNGPVPAFLQGHPRAYIEAAQFSEFSDERWSRSRSWTLQLSDGTERLNFGIVRRDTEISPLPQGLPSLSPRYSYTRGYPNMTGSPKSPLPDALPTTVPTLRSLAHAWTLYSGDPRPLNGWNFVLGCVKGDCTDVRYTIGVGHISANSSTGASAAGLTTTSLAGYHFLFVDGADEPVWDSTPLRIRFTTQNDVTTGVPMTSAPAGHAASVASGLAWRVPGAQRALEATLVAALVGALWWAWPYLRAGLVGLFSRVEGPDVLRDPRRQEILRLVETNPGIHFMEIVRRLAIGHGNLEHHLRKLRQAGLLNEFASGGYRCYSRRGAVDASMGPAFAALKSDGARAILRLVLREPGIHAGALAERSRMSAPTVSYHLRRLVEANLVETRRAGARLVARPTARAAGTLQTIAAA